MLSKDEILKKKGKLPEQLDLVRDLDEDKNKTKSRLLLLLFLILTIGSSASLWAYREYRHGKLFFNFSLPKLSTPIPTDKNIWQICFFDKSSKKLIYQQKCNMSELPKDIVKNNIDLIKSSLPNGLVVNESISTSSPEIIYVSDISSPKFNYFLSIKIYESNPLINSQALIPKIASSLYWQFSK
ncbi:hypothetical protein CO168_03060 [Candidatus Shapirobacteria bacterium CG_4_9_14_3_um_filter_36_12]|uniref:Uncharacterized protein n=3 Tax=Candidatus Shapironibacteriota TaxID=1752721 RepID=A0A2M7XMM1_9BACT|nr:MAG: hypothetical protein COS53_02530 [Candidatus Shapirobacteria bacterium CG03_land_8_20_14_0_80_35_14]PIX67849.1 MAG: hypothetical protein COZ41_02840 [Candidatus Shapirobacteria bacterium CG_4_10_14_3_um_filter_35_13]PJA50814.1 MAG: hypothetical protein CO168_03060 [Candidatus Shapirobacteria bacterium CG_4_9_14_3_um_filter_36_12]